MSEAARLHGRTTARRRGGTAAGSWLVALVLALASTAGCAGGRFVLPSGAPAAFPEGADVWAALTGNCRSVTAMRAQLRVSGRVHGNRVPALTVGAGIEPDQLSLVAMAGARPVFNLAGRRDAAVLVNHIAGTWTRGPADDVTDALVGLALPPDRLMALVTGCVSADPAVTSSDRVGAYGRVHTADSTIYLRERDTRWALAAATFGDVVADYRRVVDGWPRDIQVQRGRDVSLRLQVIEFDRNPALPRGVFELQVPDRFVEQTLEELARTGPLGDGGR